MHCGKTSREASSGLGPVGHPNTPSSCPSVPPACPGLDVGVAQGQMLPRREPCGPSPGQLLAADGCWEERSSPCPILTALWPWAVPILKVSPQDFWALPLQEVPVVLQGRVVPIPVVLRGFSRGLRDGGQPPVLHCVVGQEFLPIKAQVPEAPGATVRLDLTAVGVLKYVEACRKRAQGVEVRSCTPRDPLPARTGSDRVAVASD